MLDILHQMDPRTALAIYIAAVIVILGGVLILAKWLREPERDGFGVYESGAAPGRAMHGMVEAPYFMVAVVFMIFDVEAALLFAWSVAASQAGLQGLVTASIFIVFLLVALAYLWMDGALDTGPRAPPAADDGP